MFFALLLLAVICLYKINFAKDQPDYMSPGQTGSVKGIFTAIILLSHLRQYIEPTLFMDDVAVAVLKGIGQLMVAMFLFYSGYGILYSAARKEKYGRTFFQKRIFKTWLHFAIAVFFYMVLSFAINAEYGLKDYVLCWIGWTSLGNSNWYVFVILALYVVTWIGLLLVELLPQKHRTLALTLFVTAASGALWIFLYMTKEAYWYNTLLCYAAGMFFFLLKPWFEKINGKWFGRVGLWVLLLAAAYVLWYVGNVAAYTLYACVFCLLVVQFTANVRVDNPVLRWLGKHTFTVYIFQRIPMIIMKELGFAEQNVLFIVVTVVGTLLLSVAFDWLYGKIDNIGNKRVIA